MNAEIDITKMTLRPTEAQHLKPGDRCVNLDDLLGYDIYEIKSVGESDGEFLLIDFGNGPSRMIHDAIHFVIQPAPLDEREFWRMKSKLKTDGYVRFSDELSTRDELIELLPNEQTRTACDYEIEHVRETILSREKR